MPQVQLLLQLLCKDKFSAGTCFCMSSEVPPPSIYSNIGRTYLYYYMFLPLHFHFLSCCCPCCYLYFPTICSSPFYTVYPCNGRNLNLRYHYIMSFVNNNKCERTTPLNLFAVKKKEQVSQMYNVYLALLELWAWSVIGAICNTLWHQTGHL